MGVAKRTGTPIIVGNDGGIDHLAPDDLTDEEVLKPAETLSVQEKAAVDRVEF